MPSSHLILGHPLLLLPPIPPSIRVFSNESAFRMRWPKYWSFSFSIIPSKEIPGLISFRRTGWISLQSKGLSRVFSSTTVQKRQFFGALGKRQCVVGRVKKLADQAQRQAGRLWWPLGGSISLSVLPLGWVHFPFCFASSSDLLSPH